MTFVPLEAPPPSLVEFVVSRKQSWSGEFLEECTLNGNGETNSKQCNLTLPTVMYPSMERLRFC
jgi:hypothetical protein